MVTNCVLMSPTCCFGCSCIILLLRFCTEKYSLSSKNLKNRFGHLTNYSVNKKNDAFGRNVDAEADGEGSKWSLQALLRWFRDNGIDDVAVSSPHLFPYRPSPVIPSPPCLTAKHQALWPLLQPAMVEVPTWG